MSDAFETARDERIVAAVPADFARAVARVIEARSTGETRAFMPLIEHPRRTVLRLAFDRLRAGAATRDVLLAQLDGLAEGRMTIDGRPQTAFESELLGRHAQAYRDGSIVADATLCRSSYELELSVGHFGFRPPRARLFTPLDPAVPPPPSAAQRNGALILWAGATDAALARAASLLLADVAIDVRVAGCSAVDGLPCAPRAEWSAALAGARAVVALGDDPGTALALSRYRRPLCAATHGAAEVLENVATFDVWDPHRLVDAVLRTLASPPPVPSPAADLRGSLDIAPPPQFGDDAELASIVITVYDRLDNLRESLRRLQRQTYPRIEIVVVNDGGPRADEICAAFPNVTYIHRDVNSGGPVVPRNDGIRASTGTYVTCMDDDDSYFPDHVARMVQALQGGADAAYCDFILQIFERGADGTATVKGYDLEHPCGITANELLVVNRLGYMTVFARRALYDAVGAYDESVAKGGEEIDLWTRMARYAPIVHADRATAVYAVHDRWLGNLTGALHERFADGYACYYDRYPATGLPLIEEQRKRHIAWLRANPAAQPRPVRYPASAAR